MSGQGASHVPAIDADDAIQVNRFSKGTAMHPRGARFARLHSAQGTPVGNGAPGTGKGPFQCEVPGSCTAHCAGCTVYSALPPRPAVEGRALQSMFRLPPPAWSARVGRSLGRGGAARHGRPGVGAGGPELALSEVHRNEGPIDALAGDRNDGIRRHDPPRRRWPRVGKSRRAHPSTRRGSGHHARTARAVPAVPGGGRPGRCARSCG
jgi:hypothetical protein